MGKMTYRDAVRAGMREALLSDPRVFLMGEDVGCYGGTYACSKGFLEEFGPERIRDTPLSESTFVGAGIGAALAIAYARPGAQLQVRFRGTEGLEATVAQAGRRFALALGVCGALI